MYTILVDRAERLDAVLIHAQLVSRVAAEDLVVDRVREGLDGDLYAPLGQEADDEQNLINYLRGA